MMVTGINPKTCEPSGLQTTPTWKDFLQAKDAAGKPLKERIEKNSQFKLWFDIYTK